MVWAGIFRVITSDLAVSHFGWRGVLLEHFRNSLLNQSDVFVGIVGQGVIRNAPPDSFFQFGQLMGYFSMSLVAG
jgi:hypothetical protein